MIISSLKIHNYRGLDINIDSAEKIAIIIGQNDSGKTNICSAILKVLDYNKRKIPFLACDSTNSNMLDIEITIKLIANDLTSEQAAIVGEYIHIDDNVNKYILVKLVSKYNNDTLEYEDTLTYGDLDEKEIRTNSQTPLDKILSIIYINPVYDVDSSKREFFKFIESNNKENDIYFSDNIANEMLQLNSCIQNEEIVTDIQKEINANGDFNELFGDLRFKVTPSIKEENLYKSLNISAYDDKNNEFNNIGDGRNKIFSMLLKSKTYKEEKQKIYIIEEPENHLYVLLQKIYISSLLSMNPNQLIITTHSPYTIDLEKINQVIKVTYDRENGVRKIYSFNGINNDDFKKFGYLINSDVAEMLYYDNVLLIEGDSERYFYSLLMTKDKDFLKMIHAKKFGIYAVDGIAFRTIKELLEKLGINVYIKTDNDIFPIKNSNLFRYAGLERCVSYLPDTAKDELKKLLNFDNLQFRFSDRNIKIPIVEEKIEGICNILFKNKILFSKHNEGFEKDFIDYVSLNKENSVTEDAIDYLKHAKLKNLHSFINEYDIDINVYDFNKNSILVSFLYDE